jgi:hypothetical protein
MRLSARGKLWKKRGRKRFDRVRGVVQRRSRRRRMHR